MRIIFFGDVHVYRLGVWPWQLLCKRFLGQMNLWFNRRSRLNYEVLGKTGERIGEVGCDLLLSGGDFTTTALHGEFELARKSLGELLDRFDTYVVPGNHDRYTFASEREKRFEKYMGKWCADVYPYHRVIGDRVHLIGIDGSRANVISDRGEIGVGQLIKLRELLAGFGEGDRVIVVCHYGIGVPRGYKEEKKRHRLIDEGEWREVLGGCGREVLYLHGHVHEPWCWRVEGAGNVVAVNCGAVMMKKDGYRRGQGFWEIRVDDVGESEAGDGVDVGWFELVHHVMDGNWNWREICVAVPDKEGEAAEVL